MKQAERAGRNVLCIIMGSLGYKSLYIIYLLKNWCTGGMLSYCVAVFHHVLYPRVGNFFFLSVSPGENKSIPNFFPLVSLLHWSPPRNWYSSTGSQETVPSVHTMAPPPQTPTLLPADLQQVCCTFLRQSSSPGKPVYTKMSPGAGRLSQLRREVPIPSVILQQTFAFGHVWNVIQPRHVNVSVKRHYRQLWTIHSKNTGQMGGSVFLKSCLYPHIMENVPLG